MEVIRKNVRVDASRRVTVELPEGVEPGEHDVLVVVGPTALRDKTLRTEEEPNEDIKKKGETFADELARTAYDVGHAANETFRREDLY